MEISTQQTNIKVIWSVLFQPLSPIFHNGNPLHYHLPGPQLWKSKLQSRNSYQTSSLQSSTPFPPLSRSFVPDTSVVATWQHITCSQTGLVWLVPAFTNTNNSVHSCSTQDSHHQSKSIPIDLPKLTELFQNLQRRICRLLLKNIHSAIGPAPHISLQAFSPHLWQMKRTHYLVHLLACLPHWHSRLYSSKMSCFGLQDTVLFWFSSCVTCASLFCTS